MNETFLKTVSRISHVIVLLYAYFETRSKKSALIMSRRRKNPHPKRAENARTVLKEEKEEPKVLCLKIPPPVWELKKSRWGSRDTR